MRHWRAKIVSVLVIFFAGFAAGIYCSAPVPEDWARRSHEKKFPASALKSDQFAQSFNAVMHRCLDFAKDAACRTGKLIKQKLDNSAQADSLAAAKEDNFNTDS